MTSPSKDQTKPLINLLRGWPAPSLLPASLIKEAADAALADSSVSTDALLYGPDPGYEPFRHSIADWLSDFYRPRQRIEAERICITGGASQNLGCILNVYTDPSFTRAIWIVAPAYFLAFRIYEDAGFGAKLKAVPEDEEGLDIEVLRREIEKSEQKAQKEGIDEPKYKRRRKDSKVYKHIIYCVPTFANPSSRTMSLKRRQELVRLAREFDALIICDDVYDFLQWPADTASSSNEMEATKTAHLPRVLDIDRELDGGAGREHADAFGNACSNGSFSKIAGPGIRVGWMEGTKKFSYGISQTGTTRSGGAPSQLTSTYINNLLETNKLQTHIHSTLQPAYSSRYRTLMKAIRTHLLPLGFTLPQTDRDIIGGYFTWLTLPSGLNADVLTKRCKDEEDVVIAGGKLFEVPGDNQEVNFRGNVRLCWSFEDEWKLEEGVKRVGTVAKRILEVEGDMTREEGFVVVEKEGDEVGEFK